MKYLMVISTFLFQGCVRSFYTDPEKCFSKAQLVKPYDAIIVPGFPSDTSGLHPLLAQRIAWAYYLYKNGYTKHIIFSGSAVYTPYVEAHVMRLYAIQLGIPPEVIFTETKAEHTTENLYYSCMLAKKAGFTKLAFATQTAQTSFMLPFRRKFKLKIDMLPVVTDSLKTFPVQFKATDISSAFVPDFVSILERQSLFKRFLGTRGYYVKKEIRRVRRMERKQKQITSS